MKSDRHQFEVAQQAAFKVANTRRLSDDDRDELTQIIAVRLLENSGRLQQVSNLPAYACTIAKNEANAMARQRKKMKSLEDTLPPADIQKRLAWEVSESTQVTELLAKEELIRTKRKLREPPDQLFAKPRQLRRAVLKECCRKYFETTGFIFDAVAFRWLCDEPRAVDVAHEKLAVEAHRRLFDALRAIKTFLAMDQNTRNRFDASVPGGGLSYAEILRQLAPEILRATGQIADAEQWPLRLHPMLHEQARWDRIVYRFSGKDFFGNGRRATPHDLAWLICLAGYLPDKIGPSGISVSGALKKAERVANAARARFRKLFEGMDHTLNDKSSESAGFPQGDRSRPAPLASQYFPRIFG